MNEFEWINVSSKAFTFCLQLLLAIKELKEKIARLEQETATLKERLVEERIKELKIKELKEKIATLEQEKATLKDDRGYDTVY